MHSKYFFIFINAILISIVELIIKKVVIKLIMVNKLLMIRKIIEETLVVLLMVSSLGGLDHMSLPSHFDIDAFNALVVDGMRF